MTRQDALVVFLFLCGLCFGGCAPSRHRELRLDTIEIREDQSYNIYRHTEPITENNYHQARLVALKIPGTQDVAAVELTESGTAYYGITVSDRWKREERLFTEDAILGPFEEKDTIAPTRECPLHITYQDGHPALSWEYPSSRNPERETGYAIYRSSSPRGIQKQKNLIATLAYNPFYNKGTFLDTTVAMTEGVEWHYLVAAFDSSGNESRHPKVPSAKASYSAELTIQQKGDIIAENKSFSTSKMYPVLGEAVQYKVRIENEGAKRAINIPVNVVFTHSKSGDTETVLTEECISIDAGGIGEVSFAWTPKRIGEHVLAVDFNADKKVFEKKYHDNSEEMTINVVESDVYFVWYGDPIHWKYVNVAQAHVNANSFAYNSQEWQRRGAMYLSFAGLGQMKKGISKKPGTEGFLIDELGPIADDAVDGFLKPYYEHKKAFADSFLAIWKIGLPSPKLAAALTEDAPPVDLLVFESYYYPPTWKQKLDKLIDGTRELDCSHRCIIGLGSARQYNRKAAALESEIAYISEKAPEIPGVGFFGSRTLPGVGQQADEMCFKYFVKNRE